MLKRLKRHFMLMLSLLCAASAVFFASVAISGAAKGSSAQKLTTLSLAVKKAAVQCYAIEGYYPPDVKYLEDNYGVIVDREKYLVYYEAFASNIMPRIEVYSADSEVKPSEVTR